MVSVLIADEELVQRVLLREILAITPRLTILEATDGRQALSLVQSAHPALVFLEVRLGGWDGLEVCRRIKSVSALHATAVIMVTTDTDAQTGQLAGCDEYVVKPYDTGHLEAIIQKMLGATRGKALQCRITLNSEAAILKPSMAQQPVGCGKPICGSDRR